MFTSRLFSKSVFGLVLFLVITAVSTTRAQAATFTVDRTDDTNVSVCTAIANDCSLRGAVEAANSAATDDIINFDASIFATAKTITLSGNVLYIQNKGILNINGTAANLLTISGNQNRVFFIEAGATATISGLTITNGGIHNQL